ncbi:MAG: LysR family transcriptional regulator [Silicimonas sp.]
MDSNIGNLVAFAHVVRVGSVSAAARGLGLTQSAVSQRIKKLEEAFGAKLLVRDREGFSLTPTGQDVFLIADKQADLQKLFDEKLSGYVNGEDGQLVIIGNAPLPALRLISAFLGIRPNVKIDFTVVDWTTSVELLQSRKIDVAVLTAPQSSSHWVSQKIGTTVYGAYLSSENPLAKAPALSLADLASEVLLLPETGSLTERVVGNALAAAGLTPRRMIRLTTFPLLKEAILQNIGVGLFLEGATADSELLVWRPVRELTEVFDICLTVPAGKEDLRLVREFLEIAGDVTWHTSR